jgi:hypothetical protein
MASPNNTQQMRNSGEVQGHVLSDTHGYQDQPEISINGDRPF